MRQDDLLGDRLRAEARAYQPEVPLGVRRRVMSGLAGVEVGVPSTARGVWVRGLMAGVAVAVVVVALVMRSRAPQPVVVQGPRSGGVRIALPDTSVAIVGDPVTLARRYIDRPLEGEVDRLMAGFVQARDTVVRVLPAPVKRSGAGTRPAGVGV